MTSEERGRLTNAANTMTSHHKPSEVSLNFSLLFFFRHFHGLKILPRVENLPLRFGVLSPVLPPSPTIVLWCCSASSSTIKAVIKYKSNCFSERSGKRDTEAWKISEDLFGSNRAHLLPLQRGPCSLWLLLSLAVSSRGLSVPWQGDAESSWTPPHIHS